MHPRACERATARRSCAHKGAARRPSARSQSANHHASQPDQNRIAFRYPLALRPAAVDDGLWDSTPASRSGAAQSRLRLARTRRPAAADATARASPPAPRCATKDQASDRRSVEARAMPRPLRAPPPSGVFYPSSLFGRLALHGPRWPFAHVAQSMQMAPDRLNASLVASDTVQVGGQQPSGPHRVGHVHRVWVQVDHPTQFRQPGRRDFERASWR
jgi:hypothetical protein